MLCKQLRQLYLGDKLSATQIAPIIGYSKSTIYRLLRKYNIPRRSLKEAKFVLHGRPKYGPGNFKLHQGYIRWYWPEHPLAWRNYRVLEHRIIYWQESGYNPDILKLLLGGASIHHKNGIKDDNRPENLELRFRTNHPHGIGEQDMIDILEATGRYGIYAL